MIATIAGDIDRNGVDQLARSANPGATVRIERRLYYPYFWLELRYATTTLLGRSAVRVACFVDARTGLGATVDPFELERVDAHERDVVGSHIGEPEARRIAARYSAHVLRNRRRALVTSSIEVLSCTRVYKPFWIVTCSPSLRLLVDGITGGLHVLAPADGGADTLRFSASSM